MMRPVFTTLMLVALLLNACGEGGGETVSTPTRLPGASATIPPSPEPTGTATTPPSPQATATVEPAATPTPGAYVTGVSGVALVGPSCPVQREDEPCPDKPWQGTIVAKTLTGAEVASTESDAEGRFDMELAPGEYELVAEADGFLPAPISLYVTVIQGQVLEVELMLDSGIR